MFDPAENNRLPLRKSFCACPSRGPVVIPNIDLIDYAYQFDLQNWDFNQNSCVDRVGSVEGWKYLTSLWEI
ncbi:hypothetical protein C1H46_017173 [Malus baccata]|uniref:Uncharacterized protein n=1 Tax=Malus baccata TaxID=106549 RepID=A0A540MF80_MALBA|nr:hypothetical protein C1H46_017173 [Malus baccata]